MSAQAFAVVGVGRAGRPGDAMVLIGLGRRSAAAGEDAGAVAGFEEPAESGWEAVAAGSEGGAQPWWRRGQLRGDSQPPPRLHLNRLGLGLGALLGQADGVAGGDDNA